jgi:hypothetical protein
MWAAHPAHASQTKARRFVPMARVPSVSDGDTPSVGEDETGDRSDLPMDVMEIISEWAARVAIGGTPLELAGTFVGEVGSALARGSQTTDASPELLLDWAIVKVGAGQVAVSLVHHLRNHPGTLTTLSPIPDLIEVTALTLASGSVLAALDLCADALYRATGGTPTSDGRYKDLGYWRKDDHRAQAFKRFPASQQWLERILASPELARIEDTRRALVHRLIGRQVVKGLVAVHDAQGHHRIEERFPASKVSMPLEPGSAPKDLGSVDELVIEAAAFGEREVIAGRDAMRSDGLVPK